MKFIEAFNAARRVSTPAIKVATPDPASTIKTITEALGGEAEQKATPLASWDAVHGLMGLNEKGVAEIASLLGQRPKAATTALGIALGVLEKATQDVIVFVHNAHLHWADPIVRQGIWNTRDPYKANGNMLVLLTCLGAELPVELSDVLPLEEALPTRDEIKHIVRDSFNSAHVPEADWEIEKMCTPVVLDAAADALIGLAAFPCDQTTAMHLSLQTGELDIREMWERKRTIVSATPGLKFMTEAEGLSLNDMGGNESIKSYFRARMAGKRRAKILLRLDEMEKMFAGNGTDTSGDTTKLLQNILTWVEDKNVVCILLLGVPGASKTWSILCFGGEFKIPVVDFDVAAMQDKHVGESGKHLRQAEKTVEAISDGQIYLIATANSLNGIPAELISRFEKGGIFFFDTPDEAERKQILALKTARYKLTPDQIADAPDTTQWTGREIDSMCNKADDMGITCGQAAKYVVPLTTSQAEVIDALRHSVHNRYLSASHEGLYKYTEPEKKPAARETMHLPVTSHGRKIRS